MDLLINLVMLIFGFFLLIKGADYFVDGSSSLAKLLRIPSIIVGLTIVSMGTSLPEMAVSISAAIKGENAIAISNVIGSNFFNLLVVLGACAVIKPVRVNSSILRREYPLNLVVTGVLAVFCADLLLGGKINRISFFSHRDGMKQVGTIDRLEGIVFLVVFIMFLAFSVYTALKARKDGEDLEDDTKNPPMSIPRSLCCIIFGIAAIAIGGDVVVASAKVVAKYCGMSDTLVGLTVVALGTSLPELVTSIVAARKGENDLAVGNVVGSNLFNILFVLGASAAISPIAVTLNSVIDAVLLIAVTIVGYLFALGKRTLSRAEGIAMLVIYGGYMVYIIGR